MVDHRRVCKSAAVWPGSSSRRRPPLRGCAARSKSLVHLFVAIAHGTPKPEALAKIVAHSRRRDLRHRIRDGRVFWGTAGSRVGVGQGAFQHRRSGTQPVVGVIPVADFQLASRILRFAVRRWTEGSAALCVLRLTPRLTPVPYACSTAVQECSISELPTRPSPSLPGLVLAPARARCRAGVHAAVFFFPIIPASASVVHEFWLRYPLAIPHNSFDLLTL